MYSELAQAIIRSGILPENTLRQFLRWGHPVDLPPGPAPATPEEVVQAVEAALQSEGLVLSRETDLEITRYFLRTQALGTLHIVVEGDGEDVETDVPCAYGCTPLGEYILQWRAEAIDDVITNGKTYLLPKAAEGCTAEPVYFNTVREAFFDDVKAFVVCTPTKLEGQRDHRK